MNPAKLNIDADRILAGLRPWVECESPTFDASAVGRMMDLASRDLALLGATIERHGMLNNDAVNFLSTASAATFALGLLVILPQTRAG